MEVIPKKAWQYHPAYSRTTNNARAVCSQPEILDHYYDLLEETLREHSIFDNPSVIFNLDETGMPLDPTPPKVVTRKGIKHATSVTSGDKAQITVLGCCNAAGYVMPPLVVFDRKTLKPEMAVGEVPGTMYGLSKNGWMDTELFELWFTHHFMLTPSCHGWTFNTFPAQCGAHGSKGGSYPILFASSFNASHATPGQGVLWPAKSSMEGGMQGLLDQQPWKSSHLFSILAAVCLSMDT